jgi:hypothetical protein
MQSGSMTDAIAGPETALSEVLHVLAALSALGCRFWLEGGWGVDALVGHCIATAKGRPSGVQLCRRLPTCSAQSRFDRRLTLAFV